MKQKLVRDNIPSIIDASGRKANIRILNDDEYKKTLLDKLVEETNELISNPSLEEYADVLEVMDCIKKAYNFSNDDIKKTKSQKKKINGSFKKKILLESIDEK